MKVGDKRVNNGGNKNAGRKPKAEEQKLIEKLQPFEKDALNALEKAVKNGSSWAIKLYFEYKYGKAKEHKDITTNGESINKPVFEFFGS